jgi:hypothetical protein
VGKDEWTYGGVSGDGRRGEVKGMDTRHTQRREASPQGHEEWDKLVVGEDTRLVTVRGGAKEMLGRQEWAEGEIKRWWRPFGVAGGRRWRSRGALSA